MIRMKLVDTRYTLQFFHEIINTAYFYPGHHRPRDSSSPILGELL